MHLLRSTLCVLLMSPIQRRLSSWFEDLKNKTLMLWFTGFESNFFISRVSLSHCAARDVLHLFVPSMRLVSLGWKLSSSWVTVTVTEPCMSLPTTTSMRYSMSPMTSTILGVHYRKRPMRNSMPCFKMTLTLVTFLAKCSTCRRVTIICRLGGGTIISITL